jgi:hypothetical protein
MEEFGVHSKWRTSDQAPNTDTRNGILPFVLINPDQSECQSNVGTPQLGPLFFASMSSLKPLYPVVVFPDFATATHLHILRRRKYHAIEVFQLFCRLLYTSGSIFRGPALAVLQVVADDAK